MLNMQRRKWFQMGNTIQDRLKQRQNFHFDLFQSLDDFSLWAFKQFDSN